MSPAAILALATAVPSHTINQVELAAAIGQSLLLSATKEAQLHKIFARSAIEQRHSVVHDFSPGVEGERIYTDLPKEAPGTLRRNEVYKREAPKLAEQAARRAIAGWGRPAQEITHVISISCTGMMAPGIEFLLIDALGLSSRIARLGINFMGCFGAFKGLAIAKALALCDPSHRILIVCTELCSLHFQANDQVDTFVANALFGDGAAAAIVGCGARDGEEPLWEIVREASMAFPDSRDYMTWDASDHGFVMRLSVEVPFLVRKQIASFAKELCAGEALFAECDWAIHPGGKAILHGIGTACGIGREELKASWATLARYGNMSSPTFLFVLEALKQEGRKHKYCIGAGFGPGLSMEGLFFRRCEARDGS